MKTGNIVEMDREGRNTIYRHTGRIDHIDILKAIGILAMVMGHVGFGDVFNKWIHIFHMPMFFIISGYLYHFQSFWKMIKRRTKTLLVPYFVFGIIHCFLFFVRNGKIDIHAFYLLLWENTAENGIPIAGALWFLTAMWVTELLFWCIQSMRLSAIKTTIIAAIIAVIGLACSTYLPIRLPWAIDVGMVGVGFYQTGKHIREVIPKILEAKCFYYIIGIIFFSVFGLLFPYVNLRIGEYGIWPVFWINAVGMTVSLWGVSRYVNEFFAYKNIRYLYWLKGIGRDSILYLCLNQLAILLNRDLIGTLIPYNGTPFLIMKRFIILVLALAELLVLQNIVQMRRRITENFFSESS